MNNQENNYLPQNLNYSIDISVLSKLDSKITLTSTTQSLSSDINKGVIYHNDYNFTDVKGFKKELNTNDLTSNLDINLEEITARLPLFFKSKNTIKIPAKVKVTIERYLSKQLLRSINKNEDVAVELCLLFLSNLTDTYFFDEEKEGWKNLNSGILIEQFYNYDLVLKIKNALLKGTANGPIIECDEKWSCVKHKSLGFRLSEKYRNKGIFKYELKTKIAIDLFNKNYYKKIADSMDNTICKNLIRVYSQIELPTKEEIIAEAKRLVKIGYIKNKKKLIFLNKHSKDYFTDYKNKFIFVEDSIEHYEFLVDDGFMIPMVGDDKSGGRVYDSFSLMPSWIRKIIKINGKLIDECDYVALHPNLAMTIYGGNKKFITHNNIAEESGIHKDYVKDEHLSFFNKELWQMKKSELNNYYLNTEPKMMKCLIEDKNKNGYKITSKRLFLWEVTIMTKVIEILNNLDIYVIYVYDALYCSNENYEIVKRIMNEIVLSYNVHTTVKNK